MSSKDSLSATALGPAWLPFLPGSYIGAITNLIIIGFIFLTNTRNERSLVTQVIAIVTCGTAVLLGLWTVAAINSMWIINNRLRERLFDDATFRWLIVITLLITGIAIGILVEDALAKTH
jgi:hypothetical protein